MTAAVAGRRHGGDRHLSRFVPPPARPALDRNASAPGIRRPLPLE
jgi:hypothetical protein